MIFEKMTNDLNKFEKKTIHAYDQIAKEWRENHSEINDWQKIYSLFRQFLQHGKVIEVGCGGGRDAKVLIKMGFEYVGTDVSANLINEARREVPNGKFFCSEIYHLDFDTNQFDGFWALAVLLHIPKSKIDLALRELIRVVREEGVGVIVVKAGKGEKFITETIYGKQIERFWAFYDREEFDAVLARNALEVVHFEKWRKSPRTCWLIYLVRVRK